MSNYYEILGVDHEATDDTIRMAYRKKASKMHPDKEGGSHEAFVELKAAYEVLSDPEKRDHYDQHGEAPNQPTMMDAAKSELAAYFSRVVALVVEGQFKPNINIVSELTSQLHKLAAQCRAQRVKAVCIGKGIRKVRSRLSCKSQADTLLKDVLAMQLQGLVADYKAAKLNGKKVAIMIELMDNYSYKADPEPVNPWGTSTTYFG